MVWSRRKKLTTEEIHKGSYNTVTGGGLLSLNQKTSGEDDETEMINIIADSDNSIALCDIEVNEKGVANMVEISSAINQLYKMKPCKKIQVQN